MSWSGRPSPEAWSGAPGFYETGRTPYFASAYDPRLSFCLYVPRRPAQRVAALVHGTGRAAEAYRDALAGFAEDTATLILAPLFPAGLAAPGDLSAYKRLRHGGVAYDLALIAMVDEVRARFGVAEPRFLLHGYSGGGHFAHRFLMVHPDRLLGCSVGAPGIVTRLDPSHDWWAGARDFEAVFGRPLDIGAIARVPVHLVVGERDVETWEITLRPGDGWWMEGAEWQADATRIARLDGLRRDLEGIGARVTHDLVPGAAHDARAMFGAVERWFRALLPEPAPAAPG